MHDFNINPCQLGNQPVVGKPRDTDKSSQENRDHNSDERDLERVQGPDDKRPGVRVRRRVWDQVLTDFKGRFLVQKAPTGGDGLPFEVQQGVVYEIVGEQPHQAKYANLVNDGALPGIKPEGNFFRWAAVQYVVMCVRHAHAPAGN